MLLVTSLILGQSLHGNKKMKESLLKLVVLYKNMMGTIRQRKQIQSGGGRTISFVLKWGGGAQYKKWGGGGHTPLPPPMGTDICSYFLARRMKQGCKGCYNWQSCPTCRELLLDDSSIGSVHI